MSAASKYEHQCVAIESSPSHAFPHSLLLDTTEASAKTCSADPPTEAACRGGARGRGGGDVTLASVDASSFVARVRFLWPAAWGPSQSPAAEAGGAAGAEEALAALSSMVVASQHLFLQWQ